MIYVYTVAGSKIHYPIRSESHREEGGNGIAAFRICPSAMEGHSLRVCVCARVCVCGLSNVCGQSPHRYVWLCVRVHRIIK